MRPSGQVREAWAAIEDEVEEVEPGRCILANEKRRLRPTGAVDRVRLLPAFDPALLGHKDRSHIVGKEHLARIYRKAGWVTPALLVDGSVAGVWSHGVKAKRLF